MTADRVPDRVEYGGVPCPDCDAKGSVRCPRCRGEGHVVATPEGAEHLLMSAQDMAHDVVQVTGQAWADVRDRLRGADREADRRRRHAVAAARHQERRAAGDRAWFYLVMATGVCGGLATLAAVGLAT